MPFPPDPKGNTPVRPELYNRSVGPMGEYEPPRHARNNVSHEHELVTCALDGCLFSAGNLRGHGYMWLEDNLRVRNETAVTIHSNYMKGNTWKMKVMDAYGIWLYNYTEGACESNPNKGPLVCSSEPRLCQKGVSVVIDSYWKKAHPHGEDF